MGGEGGRGCSSFSFSYREVRLRNPVRVALMIGSWPE